jgi:hypothetical protein
MLYRKTIYLYRKNYYFCNCFPLSDYWYKSAINPHLENSIIIEVANNNTKNKIIGVLLQDYITPCNKKIKLEDQESNL